MHKCLALAEHELRTLVKLEKGIHHINSYDLMSLIALKPVEYILSTMFIFTKPRY